MATYRVERTVEALVTDHASTDTTAVRAAEERVAGALETVTGEDGVAASAPAGRVSEHPAAPFEPYRTAVAFTVTVEVEAPDEASALERGESAVDAALERVDLPDWQYVSEPELAD